MIKTNILIYIYLLLNLSLLANNNPLSDFISDEDYNIAIEKFSSDKNIFKPDIIDKNAMINEIKNAEHRVNSIFTSVSATVYADRKYGLVVHYNDPKIGKNRRLVLLGEKAIRVDGYLYYLIPYESGLRIKDVRTGNFYRIETRGRWINAKKEFYIYFNNMLISFNYF